MVTRWGDYITLEYGKPVPDKGRTDGRYPVFGTNGQIGTTNLKPLCNHPSVIIGRKGAYRGVHYSDGPFSVIDTGFYMESKTEQLDYQWAYYKFLTYDINSMDSGSAIPSTDRYEIYHIPVVLPPIEIQRQQIQCLSKIDSLISINQKINDYLDEQMKITYEHLFQNCASFIPLGDICDVQKGLSYKGNGLGMSGSLLINLGNIQPGGGFRTDNNKFYTGEYKPKYQVKAGDIVIANTDMTQDRVILGSPAIVPDYEGTILFTHHLFAFRDVKCPISFLYYYLRSSDFHNKCESSANGTTVLAVNREDILSCLVPADMEKIQQFGSICDNNLKLMKINSQQKDVLKD